MEKIKNALKSVNKFGLLALVLVAFSTLAFKAKTKDTNVLYGKDAMSGVWVPLTPSSNYLCDGTSDICTRLYEEGKNPIDHPNDYIEETPGVFTPF